MIMNHTKTLIKIIEGNEALINVFDAIEKVGLERYYLGAGAVMQTVWNHLSDIELSYGISDIDIVYFDEEELSKNSESLLQEKIKNYVPNLSLWLDIKNQARVHLWYEEKFGYKIKPYQSVEGAIDTWPTTVSALGIRRTKDQWIIYAPYGLEDLFNMNIRANNRQITEDIYLNKVKKWQDKWPHLKYQKWDNQRVEKRDNPFVYINRNI